MTKSKAPPKQSQVHQTHQATKTSGNNWACAAASAGTPQNSILINSPSGWLLRHLIYDALLAFDIVEKLILLHLPTCYVILDVEVKLCYGKRETHVSSIFVCSTKNR